MKAPRILRHDPLAPSLRERAADLSAKAKRLLGRAPADADPRRRALVTTGLAAAVAAPLPALAAPPNLDTMPHPDRAVFEAQANVERCREVSRIASQAFGTAYKAFWRDLGPYPSTLLVWSDQAAPFASSFAPSEIGYGNMFAWATPEQGGKSDRQFVWTTEGLRLAIKYAVPIFGVGGQTPFRIRDWRSLIPVAEAFEARYAALAEARSIEALRTASTEAGRALTAAQTAFLDTPATTPEGLAVIVRHLTGDERWWRHGPAWECLVRGAAAVSGVTLVGPDFDAAAWVREWEAIGGSLQRMVGREWGMIPPRLADVPEERRADVRSLEEGWHSYPRVICRHLDATRPA